MGAVGTERMDRAAEEGMARLLTPVGEACRRVLATCRALPPRSLRLADALGCVLAAPVVATQAVPPFTSSAMDGYALRAAETSEQPTTFRVVGELLAGSSFTGSLGAGEAVRIMTGAPLPAGADAVCEIERADGAAGDASVTIACRLQLGENVRRRGSDVDAGDEVLPAGTALTPAALGLLASVGRGEVLVHPRPSVGVLSTGDELVEGQGLGLGKIHDANRPALLALLAQSGFGAVDLGAVGDEPRDLARALAGGAERCDAVITSGGVSVGDHDMVKRVLAEVAGTMQWLQVAVKPAKPFAFGTLGAAARPVFALPGNPVAAMVSFELFARPALRLMAGFERLERPSVLAVADEPMARQPDGKLHLVRVTAGIGDDGLVHVRSAGGQQSYQLRSMARANALALLPDGCGVAAGGRVRAMLLDAGELAALPARPHMPNALGTM